MRDYDKNPIIIKDYNYIFLPLLFLPFIPVIIYTILYVTDTSYYGLGLVTAIVYMHMCLFFRAFNKRTIVLSSNSIKFFHKNKILETIYLDEITDIKRTFSILYHKSQVISDIVKFFQILLFPIGFVTWYLPLTIIKFFFHFFKRGSKYRFFDAIIVFSGDKFINILPATEYEYQEVRKYFMIKKPIFDVEQAKVFWSDYGHYGELIADKELL
ncbi:MAG: hypothetical protein LBJ88_02695 [Campylobacteraceae bacterium]|jgi:hypothetical protein|nr:hypothetical protein [Campylobacteraceae bacterium]